MASDHYLDSFKKFLVEFASMESPTEESTLPFRLQSYTLTEDEVQGEVLEWCMAYLEKSQCPDYLKFAISSEIARSITSAGLDEYKKEQQINNEEEEKDNVVCYSATPIAKKAIIAVHEICTRWNANLPDFKIPPACLKEYSVCGIKNTRRKMEDKHVIISDLNTLLNMKDHPDTQFYAVYDGHGGLDASVYASKQVHLNLVKQETFTTDVEDALKKSILLTDENFCAKSNRESLRSGSTAVVAVIRENVLYSSWIGDSQAVLVRNGKAVTLMEPHKPERQDEKQRIEALGGCVIWFGAWRVNGTLSVSRAIGDATDKPFVCGDADTSKTKLTGDDEYLCLACDGFWDVFNGDQLASLVRKHMKATGDKNSLARFLCTQAKNAGSSDNITVLVVFLRDEITLVEEEVKAEDNEAVSTDDKDDSAVDNTSPSSEETKSNAASTNNSNNNNSVNTKGISPSEMDIVVGSRLQPAPKERAPHKLFINKPQNISSQVNVIVTKSSPHMKLPCSVVTHKPRHSPQISPKMKRRDTRGSLLSLSTIESEEVMTVLNLGRRDTLNDLNTSNTQGLAFLLLPDIKGKTQAVPKKSPAPSCLSEPITIADKISLARHAHHPAEKMRGRQLYRASIVMSNTNHHDSSSQYYYHARHHNSQSYPESLQSLHEAYVKRVKRRPQSSLPGNRITDRFPSTKEQFDKENVLSVYDGRSQPIVIDTDIAITNSLFNRIRPKKNNKTQINGWGKKSPHKSPVRVVYRRQRSRSAI